MHLSNLLPPLLPPRLHALVDRCHTTRQILIPLSTNHETRINNHIPKVLLAREPFDRFHQVLITIPIPRDQLSNQRDRAKAPLLVNGVEKRVLIRFAKLQTSKDATGLEHAVSLAQGGGDVAKVSDTESDGIQVDRLIGDSRGGGVADLVGAQGFGLGQVFGVGFEEGEGGLLAGGQGSGALFADGEHGGVDVGDGHAHVGVAVEDVRRVQHPEGDVAGAAGYVEDVLRGAGVGGGSEGGEAGVEGGDEVVSGERRKRRRGLAGLIVVQHMSFARVGVGWGSNRLNILPYAMPAKRHEIIHAIIRLGNAGENTSNALSLLGLGDGLEAEVGRTRRIGNGIFGY